MKIKFSITNKQSITHDLFYFLKSHFFNPENLHFLLPFTMRCPPPPIPTTKNELFMASLSLTRIRNYICSYVSCYTFNEDIKELAFL